MKYDNIALKMKFKYQIVTLLVFSFFYQAVLGQGLIPIFVPIDEKDTNWNIVQTEIERITKLDPNSPTGIKIDNFGALNVKDANFLFPDWRFYGFDYSMYVKKEEDKHKVSIPFGLGFSLAVSSEPNNVKTFKFYNYGNYDEYGKFLIVNKIPIYNANDAKLVWDAFCEIHRKAWKSYKNKNVSNNEWKLGMSSGDQGISADNEFHTIVTRTYYYKVITDPNSKQITGWKSTVETSNKRVEKIQ